jgi:hypothetical protein
VIRVDVEVSGCLASSRPALIGGPSFSPKLGPAPAARQSSSVSRQHQPAVIFNHRPHPDLWITSAICNRRSVLHSPEFLQLWSDAAMEQSPMRGARMSCTESQTQLIFLEVQYPPETDRLWPIMNIMRPGRRCALQSCGAAILCNFFP